VNRRCFIIGMFGTAASLAAASFAAVAIAPLTAGGVLEPPVKYAPPLYGFPISSDEYLSRVNAALEDAWSWRADSYPYPVNVPEAWVKVPDSMHAYEARDFLLAKSQELEAGAQ
jgi:hypothetical protein